MWNGRSEELTTLCGLAFGDLCVGSNPTPNQCFELVNGKVRLLDTTFEVLMSKIDGTRSPGSPYSNAGYPTNADIPIGMLRAAVEERLTLLYIAADKDLRDLTYQECISFGLADPLKVHIKGELTKIDKLGRCIFGHAIVDRFVWQVIFNDVLQQLPAKWLSPFNVSSVGIDFNKSAEFMELIRNFKCNLKDGEFLASDDVQGWEYMFNQTCYRAFFAAYRKVAGVDPSTIISRILKSAESIIEKPAVVALSDGKLIQLPTEIMLSGWLLTHLANTIVRAATAELVADKEMRVPYGTFILPQKANGDDDVGRATVHSVPNYQRLGLVVTPETCSDSAVGFCSQLFTPEGSYPETVHKMFANFTFNASNTAQVSQIRSLLVNHPKYMSLVALIDVLHDCAVDDELIEVMAYLEADGPGFVAA